MANDTLLCKVALGTLEDFTTSQTAVETIPHIVVRERINNSSNIVDSSKWVPELYRVIMRRYRNWEICYTNVSDFLDALWERAEIHFPNYYYRKSVYDKLLSMTDDELLNTGKSVQKTNGTIKNESDGIKNTVEHNNDIVIDPLNTVLQNITTQDATKGGSTDTTNMTQDSTMFADKSERIRAQIYNANMTLLEDFLRKFKSLFVLATSRSGYYG